MTKNENNRFKDTRKASAIYKSDKEHAAYKQAVETLHYIQSLCRHYCTRASFGIRMALPKGQGDIDNYAKAILDALQGVVYANDKQCKYIEVYERENI